LVTESSFISDRFIGVLVGYIKGNDRALGMSPIELVSISVNRVFNRDNQIRDFWVKMIKFLGFLVNSTQETEKRDIRTDFYLKTLFRRNIASK